MLVQSRWCGNVVQGWWRGAEVAQRGCSYVGVVQVQRCRSGGAGAGAGAGSAELIVQVIVQVQRKGCRGGRGAEEELRCRRGLVLRFSWRCRGCAEVVQRLCRAGADEVQRWCKVVVQ